MSQRPSRSPSPPRERRRRFRPLKELAPIAAACAVALVARTSLADHYVVPSGSMEPTVEVGDHILVDKLAFGLRSPLVEHYLVARTNPQPGDVVVLASPESRETLLKRVVGAPGDTVAVRAGRLERNGASVPVTHRGEQLVEELGASAHPLRLDFDGGPDFGPVRVPAGRYLVMGDNRGNSYDGQSFGFVERDAIRGRAVRVFLRHGALAWHPL